jgi:cytochrome P450
MPIMKTELHHALGRQFETYTGKLCQSGIDPGLCLPRTDWQPIQIYPKIVQIVAGITAGVLVGPELGRDTLWIDTMLDNTKDFITASVLLKFWPAWTRSIVKFTMPQIWRIRQNNKIVQGFIAEVLCDSDQEKNHAHSIHDILAMVPEDRKTDYSFQANCQLGLYAVGLPTTARMLCHALFDLATYPGYIPILREEIYSARKFEFGSTVEYCNALVKMDSFIKESMRLRAGPICMYSLPLSEPWMIAD